MPTWVGVTLSDLPGGTFKSTKLADVTENLFEG
jgi:hypothetical protein